MERRSFIKTGLVTVAAGASSPEAFREIIAPLGENITLTEMENFIGEMDTSMDLILNSGGYYLKNLIPKTPLETDLNFHKASMRSLLLIGNFGDLSVKGQVHPWMQKRMIYSASEINYTVTNSVDIIRNLSSESKEKVKSALIDDPDLGNRILESLDLEAGSIGIPSARRRQMNVMGTRIIRRLRHSPEILIDEYVKKAEKLTSASHSNEDMDHLLRKQMGEIRFSTRRDEAERAALEWRSLDIPDMPIGYSPIMIINNNYSPSVEEISPKNRSGLSVLGIGCVMTAVGWIILAAGGGIIGAVLGVTVGPILILIGLIIRIILAISNSKKKPLE